MSGLVEELQRDALDATVSVSMLLRKVRLAAAKLNLPSVEAWVETELNGYTGNVPPYRILRGRPRALNPIRGWIPIQATAEWHAVLGVTKTGQPIGEMEHILSREGTIHIPIDRDMIDLVNQNMHVPFAEMSVFVGRAEIAGILDRVRTMVLDWAIALEREGIKGEGMSFKQTEKAAAANNPAINIGNIGTFVGFVGNNNNVRDVAGGSISSAQIRNLAEQLRSNHETLVNAGANSSALSSAVEGLLIEAGRSDPSATNVRSLLLDARAALAGAAGNLMASGALQMIGAMVGS